MALGDFEAAWRISDRVLAKRDKRFRDDPALPYHLRWVWDGRPLEDKRVLVRCYHGLGDTLQFSRYLRPLRHRTVAVRLEVQPDLVGLLKNLDAFDEVFPFDPGQPSSQSDCDVEIMELPHALRLVPKPKPYLSLGSPLTRSGVFRVGLCWRSSPTWLPERSIPSHVFAPVLACPNIEFVSLQRGGALLPGLADDCPMVIADTAERIAGLDLVLSVDTMVPHLAGALGVPIWLLLKAEPDWRWLGGGDGSLWYAGVRKYIQTDAGNWDGPVRAVVSDLQRIVSTGTLKTRRGSHIA